MWQFLIFMELEPFKDYFVLTKTQLEDQVQIRDTSGSLNGHVGRPEKLCLG